MRIKMHYRGHGRIMKIDDSRMYFGYSAWVRFINSPWRLTPAQKACLNEYGITSAIIANRVRELA